MHRAVQEEEPVKPAAEPGAEEPADEASGIPSGTGDPQPKPDSAPQPEQARVTGKNGKTYPKKRPAKSKAKSKPPGEKPANAGKLTRDQAVLAICAELIKKPRETIEDFIKLVEDARLPTLKLPEDARFYIVMNFAAALGFGHHDLRLRLNKTAPQEKAK